MKLVDFVKKKFSFTPLEITRTRNNNKENKSLTGFKSFLTVLICFGIIFGFYVFQAKASPSAKVQFTANTEIALTGLPVPLYVLKNSECDLLKVSGPILTVDIPCGSNFTLGTATHNVLGLTPLRGTVSLTFSSVYFLEGYVNQWTASSLVADAQVRFLVGVPQPNHFYLVKVDGVNYGFFRADSLGYVSFTYTGGFSERVFSVAPKGDLNNDGEVSISDVILCLRMTIDLPVTIGVETHYPPYPQWLIERADMNVDGEVSISDVILVLRKTIGL